MKIRSILPLIGLISLVACKGSQKEIIAPSQEVNALYQRFHGKYKPVFSTSSEAIDVNLDGKATVDMLEEIPELLNIGGIELRIYQGQYNSQRKFIFVHYWPKQEFQTDPATYIPDLWVPYSMKVVSWSFKFDTDVVQLLIEPQSIALADPDTYTPLQAVKVVDDDRIEVIFSKRLYTASGWKTVQIRTRYERYTMTT
jgi:hypothetical protein